MTNLEMTLDEYFDLLHKKATKEQMQILLYLQQNKICSTVSSVTAKQINSETFHSPVTVHILKSNLTHLLKSCLIEKSDYKYYITKVGLLFAMSYIKKRGVIK